MVQTYAIAIDPSTQWSVETVHKRAMLYTKLYERF